MQPTSWSPVRVLALTSLLAAAACGSEVESPGSGSGGAASGTGGSGAGAQGSTTSAMDGMCDGHPCCTGQAGPGQCCESACCPSNVGCGPGSGGGGSICGGKAGLTCAASDYCDYGNDLCGNGDNTGTCTPRPLDCPRGEPEPACGCDGMVYPTECLANLAGHDVSNSGGCTVPAGTFACGKIFCQTGAEYCLRSTSDVGGFPDSYACQPLPPACAMATPPSCDCLKAEPCGDLCEITAPGGIQLTCPGG